uniref:Uncharacterized protein n=1 Tax=Glossina brevipalpis TaxID=37001 RepID=A0A1A9WX61_9MUSC
MENHNEKEIGHYYLSTMFISKMEKKKVEDELAELLFILIAHIRLRGFELKEEYINKHGPTFSAHKVTILRVCLLRSGFDSLLPKQDLNQHHIRIISCSFLVIIDLVVKWTISMLEFALVFYHVFVTMSFSTSDYKMPDEGLDREKTQPRILNQLKSTVMTRSYNL